jgi:dienelactone hydrolase
MRPAVLTLALAALLAGDMPARADDDEAAQTAEPEPRIAQIAQPAQIAQSAPATPPARWCAPELDALPGEVCSFVPAKEASGPRTLVIFLHGVIQPDTGWQWAQQRGAARVGAKHGFSVLMPRGRRGIGPKTMEDWWTWPTAASAQKTHEDALIAEWDAARAELERSNGKRFERVYVFGFSNGAYYATSLAMRGRLPVSGYGVFAGGSGATYLERAGAKTKQRAPIFVGWGGKDKAHGDQVALVRMLRKLNWPSKSLGQKRAGHAMTDDQVAQAVAFLAGPPAAQPGRPKKKR